MNSANANSHQTGTVRSNPLLIAAAWAIVSVPALWGVAQTLRTSLKLFTTPASVSTNK